MYTLEVEKVYYGTPNVLFAFPTGYEYAVDVNL